MKIGYTNRMIRTLLTVLFLTVLSTPGFADWTKVDVSVTGNTYYVDFERIRKHDGYVYYWTLSDLLKPTENGNLSYQSYKQGDCKLFRYMNLSFSFHKEPMGGGTGDVQEPVKQSQGWKHPPPISVSETILKSVCKYAK